MCCLRHPKATLTSSKGGGLCAVHGTTQLQVDTIPASSYLLLPPALLLLSLQSLHHFRASLQALHWPPLMPPAALVLPLLLLSHLPLTQHLQLCAESWPRYRQPGQLLYCCCQAQLCLLESPAVY